jgi:DNA-binding LacI/PurR family transcriptional regulator
MARASATRTPVLADVARLAGVSTQTVSRVVNGASSISPQTKGRVERAIQQFGYRPNAAARALVRGRTGLIGVISTGFPHFGPTSILRSIEDPPARRTCFVTSVSLPTLTRELLDEAVEHFMRLLVGGVVIVAGQDEARARRDGWRTAMLEAGIRPPQPLPGDWSLARGYSAAEEVLDSGAAAVFAANDQMAIGLLSARSRLPSARRSQPRGL